MFLHTSHFLEYVKNTTETSHRLEPITEILSFVKICSLQNRVLQGFCNISENLRGNQTQKVLFWKDYVFLISCSIYFDVIYSYIIVFHESKNCLLNTIVILSWHHGLSKKNPGTVHLKYMHAWWFWKFYSVILLGLVFL